jgi:hypothetical protein
MKVTVLCEGERRVRNPQTRRHELKPCTDPATTTRKNRHVLGGPKVYNYCVECAAMHDEYESELEFESRVS